MKFYVYDHNCKAAAYIAALENAGHKRAENINKIDFLLVDHDQREPIEECIGRMPVFLYPHSAKALLFVQQKEPRKVTCNFTIAEGHKEVADMLHYPFPTEIMGWTYTPLREFQKVKPDKNTKVLFAPIHPLNGQGNQRIKYYNRETFNILTRHKNIDLSVRYIDNITESGIWDAEGIRYINGRANNAYYNILENDLVIANDTFAHMSVALGKPTVFLNGETNRLRRNERPRFKQHKARAKYKNLVQYPYNMEAVFGKPQLAERIFTNVLKTPVNDWKIKFIGEAFEPEKFAERIEHYVSI
jgi:hypothetical protein